MKRGLFLLSVAVLAGCHGKGGDEVSAPIKQAEALVSQSVKDKSLTFDHVQAIGDGEDGRICGYFYRANELGGTDAVRFITFNDGNSGANPYIDQPTADFPQTKADFAIAWKNCVKGGYNDPNASDEDSDKKKKKEKR